MSAVAAAIGATAAIGGSLIASSGAKNAAKTQAAAADRSAQVQQDIFNKQVELQAPFREAGLTAQNQLLQLLGIGGDKTAAGYGSAAQSFGMDQFQADPGYQFRQDEGMKALERSAAARGGLLSGSMLKGIQRFSQGQASDEYNNAFNRYQVERNARLNPLQSLMGAGQTGANTLTNAAGQLGQGLSDSIQNAGAARASGYVGSSNALASALGGIGNSLAQGYAYNSGGGGNVYNRLTPSAASTIASNPGIF
jgi:hypothetical protein